MHLFLTVPEQVSSHPLTAQLIGGTEAILVLEKKFPVNMCDYDVLVKCKDNKRKTLGAV